MNKKERENKNIAKTLNAPVQVEKCVSQKTTVALHVLIYDISVFFGCPFGAVPHRPAEVSTLVLQGRRSYESIQGIRFDLFE